MSNLNDFKPSSTVTTTVTTTVQVVSSVWGDGPTIGITDDATTELIDVNNTSGAIGRVTLPNVTTIGKTIYFKPRSSPNVYVDYVHRSGSNSTLQNAGALNGATTIQKLVWLGSWVEYASHS